MNTHNFRNNVKPIRMWIDGNCYNIRQFDTAKYDRFTLGSKKSEDKKDRPLTTKIHLPSMYYIQLARFRMTQIDAIQNETNTIINYPMHGNDGFLEISGDSGDSIEEAKEQIHSIIANIRNREPPLQFIAIPLLSNEIKKNFEEFKEKILVENYQGVEESIFQSASKLHLTIVVFTLLNDQEKQQALKVLEECKTLIQKKRTSSKIRISGLKCMNDDYSKVNVLYAEASFTEDSGSEKTLQEISNFISQLYYERGLSKEYIDNVKIHMTIMNTKYRKKKEGTPRRRWVKRETFDATKIMERFKNYHFGDAIFDNISLSLISSQGEDGFYKCLGSIHV